jgi:hypothetical protein
MSVVAIVLITLGVVFLLCVATCVGGAFFLKHKAEGFIESVAEGGKLVLVAPDEVKAALAGAKKDYVGSWSSKKGSTLTLDANGNLQFDKDEDGDGVKEKFSAPVAAFVGNDMQCEAIVTITFHVTQPPKMVDGHWQMVVDGVPLSR